MRSCWLMDELCSLSRSCSDMRPNGPPTDSLLAEPSREACCGGLARYLRGVLGRDGSFIGLLIDLLICLFKEHRMHLIAKYSVLYYEGLTVYIALV